jgi:hypothetical protein
MGTESLNSEKTQAQQSEQGMAESGNVFRQAVPVQFAQNTPPSPPASGGGGDTTLQNQAVGGADTVQERFRNHTLTEADLSDPWVIEELGRMSIEQLFAYRRACTDATVKARLLTTIDARQRDPARSYLGKKFRITGTSAVIRDTNGNALTYRQGETLPAGRRVGDQKTIPNGTEVYVTDVKPDLSNVLCEDWGWTAIDNIQGGMYNETLTLDRAEFDSTDPNHKTIATPDAQVRTNTVTSTFPAATPRAIIPQNTRVTVVERAAQDGGNVLLELPNGSQAWTRASNISRAPAADGSFTVTDREAVIRVKSVDYAAGTGIATQGARVIVLNQSADTTPAGRYLEVAYTKKDAAGTYVRDDNRNAFWIAASDLADNWADYKSDNARWVKSDTNGTQGVYLGQMDVVTMVGAVASSGNQEVEKLSPELLGHYNTLRAQASSANHDIRLNSGFRSFPNQQELWDANPNPARVARPGRSNHQNGIAIDINTGSFSSAMYLWMVANAPALGWIRTVDDEHWHWEYRPADAAANGFKLPGVNP